ncbi:hypothetical protein PoB_007268200 [Plakobranchus ocellatus]|uniref:Uncharacterized protein n=1 Tax=Plakobranchus ocellatus TaxID=259542 RepID=A0AAV4DPZ4_9GAST|nr:hypothetical protein PoB_007268200 [Plakobranchus ocellatus]
MENHMALIFYRGGKKLREEEDVKEQIPFFTRCTLGEQRSGGRVSGLHPFSLSSSSVEVQHVLSNHGSLVPQADVVQSLDIELMSIQLKRPKALQ